MSAASQSTIISNTELAPVPDNNEDRPEAITPPRIFQRVSRIWRILLPYRIVAIALAHMAFFTAALWIAFCLRFDFQVPDYDRFIFWTILPWILALKLVVFYSFGHFHGWWRYVTFSDLAALVWSCVISFLLIVALDHYVFPFLIPRSVVILDAVASLVFIGSFRASWRAGREMFWPMINGRHRRRTLLVGANDSAGILAHQIHSHSQLPYRITGFLDPTGEHLGTRLGNVRVLGTVENVRKIAAAYGIRDVLVTAGSLSGARLRKLKNQCDADNLGLKIIPPVEDMFAGSCTVPIRDVEINDLLRREPVQLDSSAINQLLEGRTILVTGAGGSIGSEICRQVLRFHPHRLLLLGRGERSIFAIHQELSNLESETELKCYIGDVRDEPRMRELFEVEPIDVVFHAAAHKHVPLMESNVGEAIKNNVFGTKCVADLAHETGVGSFVLISTDKAVNPTSVMGASKHLAERYVHALSQESKTRFSVVRFGNVLGSTGSVVPIFQEQIRRGGPITITDPRMRRYFMTIPEASQLVLQAASMGRGGEIFVLEMGEPIAVVDLARDLIRLSGLPEDAIEIAYTGRRPGEKLYEELYFAEEATLPTPHPKLRCAYHRHCTLAEMNIELDALAESISTRDTAVLRSQLQRAVPDYVGIVSEIAHSSGTPAVSHQQT